SLAVVPEDPHVLGHFLPPSSSCDPGAAAVRGWSAPGVPGRSPRCGPPGGQASTISPTSTLTPFWRPGQPLARRAASSASAALITTYPVRAAVDGSPSSLLCRVRPMPTRSPRAALAAPVVANPTPHFLS